MKKFDTFINESQNWILSMKHIVDEQYIVYAIKNGIIGELYFSENTFKPVLHAGSVSVDPNYRRQGVASSMYVYAEEQFNKKFVRTDDVLTVCGKLLWNNPKRKFGRK